MADVVFYAGSPALDARPRINGVRCACGRCLSKDDRKILRTYSCAGCKRRLPWCYGGGGDADDMPEHCDDCWLAAHPQERA